MDWWKKTKYNLSQLLNIIPAIFDWRCIIALTVGVTFSILTYKETDATKKIVWTVISSLGNGIFITFIMEYFGEYPLKQRIIENIKSLYSLSDFLVRLKNSPQTAAEQKIAIELKITDINLSIQRWSDKVDGADIEKWKNQLEIIKKTLGNEDTKYEINITELRSYGITDDLISEITGATLTQINTILEVLETNKTNKKTPKPFNPKTIGKPRGKA